MYFKLQRVTVPLSSLMSAYTHHMNVRILHTYIAHTYMDVYSSTMYICSVMWNGSAWCYYKKVDYITANLYTTNTYCSVVGTGQEYLSHYIDTETSEWVLNKRMMKHLEIVCANSKQTGDISKLMRSNNVLIIV